MKVSGYEVKAWRSWFFEHHPTGYEIQHAVKEIGTEDNWRISDEDVVDTSELGFLVWEGDPDTDPTRGKPLSLTKAIRMWKLSNSSDVVCIELPRTNREELLQVLKTWGARVLTS